MAHRVTYTYTDLRFLIIPQPDNSVRCKTKDMGG